MLPATVPHMFTGLRIGIGMSWLAIVAAEMVQGGTGIGFFIWDSYNSSLLTDTIVALDLDRPGRLHARPDRRLDRPPRGAPGLKEG